jgi:ribokinase
MLIVFGSINADLVFALDRLPTPGQTLLSNRMTIEPGGKGANQAVAAARDGATVIMAGAVGPDGLAATALAGLQAAGIDLSRVGVADTPTGCAAICTDPAGRNHIVLAPGANLVARAAVIEDTLLVPHAILLTQMESDPAETATLIRRAHARGAFTIHNLAPAAALDPAALRLIDILVVNEDEAAWLAMHNCVARDLPGHQCASDARSLHAALGITVIRTMGPAGVEWAGPNGSGALPASAIEAVDTTAAGDCFIGVLAAALDRGDTIPDAIKRANAAAGLACTRRGSQSSLPMANETDLAFGR